MNALVVDDSKVVRKIVIQNLMKLGFQRADIYEAQDGESGLDAMMIPDTMHIVITDLDMPKMNGLDFVSSIKKNNYKNTHIFALSGHLSEENRKAFTRLGVSDFITKPFHPVRFEKALRPVLAKLKSGTSAAMEAGEESLTMARLDDLFSHPIRQVELDESDLTFSFDRATLLMGVEEVLKVGRYREEGEKKKKEEKIFDMQNLQVLIVDDSNFIRQVLRSNLEKLKLAKKNIFTAINGQDALSKIPALKNLGLIITDLQMPKMDGLEFVKRVRGTPVGPQVKVVAISGQLTRHTVGAFSKLGVKDFVKKPFDLEKFMAAVKPLIGKLTGDEDQKQLADNSRKVLEKALETETPSLVLEEGSLSITTRNLQLRITLDNLLENSVIKVTVDEEKKEEEAEETPEEKAAG